MAEKFGFVSRCKEMVESIDSGLKKFSSTNPRGDVELDNFLDDIEKEIS